MKRLIVLLIISFVIYVGVKVFLNKWYKVPPTFEIEDCEVYETILDDLNDREAGLAMFSRTITTASDGQSVQHIVVRHFFEILPSGNIYCMLDFIRKNKISSLLKDCIFLGRPYQLIPQDFSNFYLRRGNKVIIPTRPGYDIKKRMALVYVEILTSSENDRYIILLSKRNARWMVQSKIIVE
ncbi:MAG: hypothetical protein J7J61_07775 [Candidatus Hydrothermae bacterium]|nr:hypothetical protein [Candidatus Hydrothermae bacterium]